MAKITVIGRVGSVEELRTVNGANGSQSVLSFSVADSSIRTEGKDPWYRVSLWGAFAEKMAAYIKKGVSVAVFGELDVRVFTKKDGSTGVSKDIQRAEITLCGSAQQTQSDAPATAPSATATPNPNDGFMNIPEGIDEELPFN